MGAVLCHFKSICSQSLKELSLSLISLEPCPCCRDGYPEYVQPDIWASVLSPWHCWSTLAHHWKLPWRSPRSTGMATNSKNISGTVVSQFERCLFLWDCLFDIMWLPASQDELAYTVDCSRWLLPNIWWVCSLCEGVPSNSFLYTDLTLHPPDQFVSVCRPPKIKESVEFKEQSHGHLASKCVL